MKPFLEEHRLREDARVRVGIALALLPALGAAAGGLLVALPAGARAGLPAPAGGISALTLVAAAVGVAVAIFLWTFRASVRVDATGLTLRLGRFDAPVPAARFRGAGVAEGPPALRTEGRAGMAGATFTRRGMPTVEVAFEDGKRLVVSTRRPGDLAAALRTFVSPH